MEIKLFSSSSHGKCLISNISFDFLNKSCDIKEQLPFLLVMGRVGVLRGGVGWPGESGRGLLQESSTKRGKKRNAQKLYPEYLKCSARTPLFKTS